MTQESSDLEVNIFDMILVFHGGDYEDGCLLGCSAV
jgi:hypothetical protein